MIVLPDALRARHAYVIGKTRTGKTTLLLQMIRQDLLRGRGLCFLDPHGDAAEAALKLVPKDRVPSTVYFEPTEYPLGLQSFATEGETETELLCDDLITVFRRLSQSWGERMDALFRYAFQSLIRTPGTTLLDLYDLLTDDEYRARIVGGLADPILVRFWTQEYPKLPKDSATPILLRLSKFVTSPTLSRIFGSTETIDLADMMDRRQVLIVNLGRVGADVRSILGTMLVSAIQIATMRRAHLAPRARTPFYLYADEFQHFASASFETILSESGKFGLRLTLAHQFISQLDTRMQDAILGNAGTMIAFQLGLKDGEIVDRFTGYEPPKERHWVGASGERTMRIEGHGHSTLALRKYQAIARTGRNTVMFHTRPLRVPREHHAAEIKARMRERAPQVARRGPSVYLARPEVLEPAAVVQSTPAPRSGSQPPAVRTIAIPETEVRPSAPPKRQSAQPPATLMPYRNSKA